LNKRKNKRICLRLAKNSVLTHNGLKIVWLGSAWWSKHNNRTQHFTHRIDATFKQAPVAI